MRSTLPHLRARSFVLSRALVRSTWRSAFGLAIAAGVVACSASRHDVDTGDDTPTGDPVDTNEAIVHGAADGTHHPAVMALVIDDPAGVELCTGALVAPDVVLTARHCVSRLRSEAVSCPATGPQVTGNRDPKTIAVVASNVVSGAKAAAYGAEIVTPKGDALCDADIALLRLDRKIDGVEPLSFDRDDVGGTLTGKTVTSVGYGLTKNDGGKPGVRRFRSHVAIESDTHTEFVVGESTCSGDSGGPAIDEADGTILGVVSRGGADCTGASTHNVYTRIDAFLPLIRSVVGSSGGSGPTSPPASDLGAPCKTGTTCSAGVCVEPAGYCSHDCGKGKGRCEKGYKCTHKKKGDVGVCTKKS
jgi:V8-like Glu-specific endopeptidase